MIPLIPGPGGARRALGHARAGARILMPGRATSEAGGCYGT